MTNFNANDVQHSIRKQQETKMTKLAFFDTAVDGYRGLLKALDPWTQGYVIEPGSNGVNSVSRVLGNVSGVQELLIFAHGTSGRLSLGESNLSLVNLPKYADQIASWKASLGEGAAIRIYGCELAAVAEGRILADRLAELTGADVSMASGKLGFISGQPHWALDYHTGTAPVSIPIAAEALEAFRGHLAIDDQTKLAGESTAIVFGAASFVDAFNQAGFGGGLTKLKILSLPDGGALSLNEQDVAVGDELSITELNDLTFEALEDYDGLSTFDWVGHDGSDYAPASVATTVSGFGSDNGPVTVSADTLDVSGTLGNQVWGNIKVSGKGYDGEAKLVEISEGGVGISGGRSDAGIDSEVRTGESGGNSGTGVAPVTEADLQGVWVLPWQTKDGSFNNSVLELASDPLVKGITLRIPWHQIEVAEGVYDFSIIDEGIALAESVGAKVGLIIQTQTWGSGSNKDPYTAGPPKYIVDDYQTYGGAPGEGGLERSRNHPDEFRTRRWDDEVVKKMQDMLTAVIEEYDQHESVLWFSGAETALNVDINNTDYDVDKFVDKLIETIEVMDAAADRLALNQSMNFIPGGTNEHLRKVYDAAVEHGVSVGSPDLQGGSKEFNYYDVLDDGETPVDISVQWASLDYIQKGTFSIEQMLDTGIDRLDMRMMYMAQNEGSSVAKFSEVMDVIRDNPEYRAWATGGDDVPIASTNDVIVPDGDTVVSEELTLEFQKEVAQVTLRLDDFQVSDEGVWKALDSSGNVIASGALVAALGTEVSEGVYDFTINVGSAFQALATGGGADGAADFSVASVTYDPVENRGPIVTSNSHELSAADTPLSGSLGEQLWGDVEVAATNLSGEAAEVVFLHGGIGVAGGRDDGWIDYQVAADGTHSSEAISLDFNQNISSVTITIGGFLDSEPDFPDMAEAANWIAFDAFGNEIGQGSMIAGEGERLGDRSYQFEIEPGSGFTSLTISAAPYNNDGTDTNTSDNSDFKIEQLSYVVAPDGMPENNAPTVTDFEISGVEDEVLIFSQADFASAFTDSDPSDSLDKIRIESLPEHGQLMLDGEAVQAGDEISFDQIGLLAYTPEADWHGEVQFGWSGHDGAAFSTETASVKLTVEEQNDAPVASNDSGFAATGGTPVVIDSTELTKNDSDPDGDLLVVVSVGNATNGTVLMNTEGESNAQLQAFTTESSALGGLTPLASGAITFIPDAGFAGQAQFDYTVADSSGSTSTATVIVDVEKGESPNLVLRGAEDHSVRFTASDFEAVLPTAEMANSLAKIKVSSLPENGALLLNGAAVMAGNEISVSDLSGLSFKPNADWHGETQFNWIGYGDNDSWMQVSDASVVIESMNDWPVAGNDSGFTTFEDVPLTIDLREILANDTDADLDLLSVQSVGDAQNGLVSLVDDAVIFTPNDGYTGEASFDYAVSDGNGGYATATVSLDVQQRTSDPVELVAQQGNVTTSDGDTYWGDVKVSAEKWDGTPGQVFVSQDGGLGVGDGRFNGQIDFTIEDRDGDGVGGDSERLSFDYGRDVTEVMLQVDRMSVDEWGGNTEVGMWEAYDHDGRLVGSGVLDPRDGTQIGPKAYEFSIKADGTFSTLELSARPYNNVSDSDLAQDSSDYKVMKMSYTPYAEPVQIVEVGVQVEDLGATFAATETGLNEDLFSQSLDDVTQVM